MNETTETQTAETPATPTDIRTWARENGRTDVGTRGRISATVKRAFETATGRPAA